MQYACSEREFLLSKSDNQLVKQKSAQNSNLETVEHHYELKAARK
jgi:hypothetical protein